MTHAPLGSLNSVGGMPEEQDLLHYQMNVVFQDVTIQYFTCALSTNISRDCLFVILLLDNHKILPQISSFREIKENYWPI